MPEANMSDQAGRDGLSGFHHVFLTMYVDVTDVRVARSWQGFQEIEFGEPASGGIAEAIAGMAKLERDAIQVLGNKQSRTRTLPFTLRAYEDKTKLAASWAKHREAQRTEWLHEPSVTEEHAVLAERIINHVCKEFDDEPPTLVIGFVEADFEINSESFWFMEAEVPKEVLAAVDHDISANRCTKLSLHLNIRPRLADDQYAPPRYPVTFGVMGVARGWVEHMSWGGDLRLPRQSGSASDYEDEMTGEEEEEFGTGAHSEGRHADGFVLSDADRDSYHGLRAVHAAIQRQTVATTTGFVLVLILIALIAML